MLLKHLLCIYTRWCGSAGFAGDQTVIGYEGTYWTRHDNYIQVVKFNESNWAGLHSPSLVLSTLHHVSHTGHSFRSVHDEPPQSYRAILLCHT